MKVTNLVLPQRHGGHGEQKNFPFAGDLPANAWHWWAGTANAQVARPPSAESELSHLAVSLLYSREPFVRSFPSRSFCAGRDTPFICPDASSGQMKELNFSVFSVALW